MQKDNNKSLNSHNILDQLSEREKKVQSIKSMLQSIYNSGNNCEYSEAQLRQYILQKKTSNSHIEPVLVSQKTTKIKKNKKKKKKNKETSRESPRQKIWKHQLCECCCAKTRTEQPLGNQFYQSDDEDYEDEDDPTSMVNLVTCLIHQLLQQFYDQLDKNLIKWLKSMDSHPSTTFMKMVRKLSEIFQQFDTQLREQIDKEFCGLDDPILIEAKGEAALQFKNYMLARFPLLKDFIENFDLKILTEQQNQEFMKISLENTLIEIILAHMLDIANKKRKKKNKRKKQQIRKIMKTQTKNMQSEVTYESELLAWLKELKIQVDKRETCQIKEGWLEILKSQTVQSYQQTKVD